MKTDIFPIWVKRGRSLKFKAFSLGKGGNISGIFPSLKKGKKPCFKAFSPEGRSHTLKGILSFPLFRIVTGEREGGYATAAYPPLPLSVTKKYFPTNCKQTFGGGKIQ